MSQIHRLTSIQFAAVHESGFDAVDGSSTGTRVPRMWALLRLPRFRGASHADDHDNRSRLCQVSVPKPKLDPFIAVIDRILGDDKSRLKKQQHTAKRVFERLRAEYGVTGGVTLVTDYVAA